MFNFHDQFKHLLMNIDHYELRLLKPDDLHAYFKMVDKNRKRLEQFFTGTVSRTQTLEATAEFLKEIEQRIEARTYFPFVVLNKQTQALEGFFDIKNIDWSIPKAEVGCYVDEDSAGRGLTSKLAVQFCRYCFTEYQFKKLFIRTHHTNIAAKRLAEKCGFTLEGTLRSDYRTTAGELVDLLYYGKLRSEENID
jgi:ribosomal-protein-serine acetyltransferase